MHRRTMIVLAAFALPAAALAHHGWSSYDEAKPLTVTGPLKAVTWGNPHGAAKISWQRKDWDVILAPVSRMEARGLAKNMVDAGQRVTLTGYARRDGTAELRIERVAVAGMTVELR